MTKKISFLLILFAAILSVGGVCEAAPMGAPENSPGPWTEYAPLWSTPGEEQVISQYDPLIRRVASDRGYDWRLISAIANAESRFDHDVVSYAGAVGLMQV
ncbi:MAG: transglycosylase SLT domain-containing protein, partial [Alistipes sp.]|nr:transglycosylase SLT domain-containing protein [Alistipes sp.]